MNIFSNLRIYQMPWSVSNVRSFTQEEIDAVDSAVVVASQYGNSVCCHLKAGGTAFIPLSNDSTKGLGESVQLSEAQLVTLSRQGDADIQRIKI